MRDELFDQTLVEFYAKKLAKESAQKFAYIRSKQFKDLMTIIRGYDRIDQDDLIYKHVSIDGVTARQFQKVCEAVFHTQPIVEDKKSPFLYYHADISGVRFHLLVGQGSVYWTTNDVQD